MEAFESPTGMFGDERFRVGGEAFQGRAEGRVAGVSHRDCDVAQEAPVFCS